MRTTARETGASGALGGRPQAAVHGVDPHRDLDVNEAVQGKDGVGQVVVGGAQVDGALERLCEQRRPDLDVAVDRALGAAGAEAGAGGELHAGADRAEVALFDELGVGEGEREAREVGLAVLAWHVGGPQGGEGAAAGAALEAQGELRLEAEVGAAGGLEAAGELDRVGGEGFQRGALAPDRRAGLEGLAGGRVEGEAGAVGARRAGRAGSAGCP